MPTSGALDRVAEKMSLPFYEVRATAHCLRVMPYPAPAGSTCPCWLAKVLLLACNSSLLAP